MIGRIVEVLEMIYVGAVSTRKRNNIFYEIVPHYRDTDRDDVPLMFFPGFIDNSGWLR